MTHTEHVQFDIAGISRVSAQVKVSPAIVTAKSVEPFFSHTGLTARSSKARPCKQCAQQQAELEMTDDLLKVARVAEILGVGIDWGYERIKRGEIRVVELGDTRKNQRIAQSDLEAFIEARRRPT